MEGRIAGWIDTTGEFKQDGEQPFAVSVKMFMFIAWIVVYTIAYAVVSYLAILKPSEKALVTNQLRRFSR